jgi:hypothetical protein
VVTKIPEPQPEVKKPEVVSKPVEAPLPELRLVGFTEMKGLQALLAVDGKLNAMGVGDVVSGVKLVAMAPPAITLKHEGHEFEMDLMKQPWSSVPADLQGAKGTDRKLPRSPTAGAGKRGSVPPSRNNPPAPRLPDTNAARLAPASAPATATTAAPTPALSPPSLPVVPPPKLPRSPSGK